jgi:hypothetical protein
MSRGFEGRGLNRKVLYPKDFTDFIQAVTGDGDSMEEWSNLAGVLRLKCPYITDVIYKSRRSKYRHV